MLPDDATQPMRYHPDTQAAWPTRSPAQAQRAALQRSEYKAPKSGRALWAILGFIIGAIVTAALMLLILAPSSAPSDQAQPNATILKVTLTDALLTQELDAHEGQADANVSQLRAHVEAGGDIVVSGMIQTNGSSAPFSVMLQPYVSQQTLSVKVTRASIAGLLLPPSTFDELVTPLNQRLAKVSKVSVGVGKPLVVNGVSFADGSLILSYALSAS